MSKGIYSQLPMAETLITISLQWVGGIESVWSAIRKLLFFEAFHIGVVGIVADMGATAA